MKQIIVDSTFDGIRCEEVIVSTVRRKGKGVEPSPIRTLVEVYRKNGELIAEYDCFQEERTKLLMIEFAKWCMRKNRVCVGSDIDESLLDHFMQEVGSRFE